MGQKAYGIVSGIVFAVVAVMHLVRLINQTEVQFGAHTMPMFASVLGLLAAGALSAWGFSLACRCRGRCETPK